MPDTERAPDECGSIAGAEGDADDRAGNDIEPGTAKDLSELGLLQVVEPLFRHVPSLEGLDDGLVLQAFLDMALDAALALADVAGQLTHLAEEKTSEKDEERHDQDQDECQPPVHQAHEHDGGDQLDDGRKEGREFLADDAGDGVDIGEQTVQGVASVHFLLALPLGLKKIGIQALADDEIHPGVGHAFDACIPGVDGDAGKHEHCHEDCDGGDVSLLDSRGNVHEVLADPDESEVQDNGKRAQQNIEHQGAADTVRVPVQPAEICQQLVHLLPGRSFIPRRVPFQPTAGRASLHPQGHARPSLRSGRSSGQRAFQA